MNNRQHRDRVSASVAQHSDRPCQTTLSCLRSTERMVRCEETPGATVIRTNDPSKMDRQIQVNTMRDRLKDPSQVRVETAIGAEKDLVDHLINDDLMIRALVDKEGKLGRAEYPACEGNRCVTLDQQWTQWIADLIKRRAHRSPSDLARRLLDSVSIPQFSVSLQSALSVDCLRSNVCIRPRSYRTRPPINCSNEFAMPCRSSSISMSVNRLDRRRRKANILHRRQP